MIQQKLLPIKLEKSDEEVTCRSGLILFEVVTDPDTGKVDQPRGKAHPQDSSNCGEVRSLHEDEAETSCASA